ncbi:MAG TPA: hypothetical protein VFS43_37435 [Polyangiaceae bacterium]|nr:hypothetical protein [Polyangiaceae bacterium]
MIPPRERPERPTAAVRPTTPRRPPRAPARRATRPRPAALAVLSLAGALALAHKPAGAVGTRSFDLDTQDEFSGGDLRGVAVDSQGRVRAGWNLTDLTLQGASSVWAALPLADGSVLVATGAEGKVLRVAGGRVTTYAETKQMAVTSLALGPKGAVYAATVPSGKIFRIDAPGKLAELPKLTEAENVWDIAYDAKKNALYAATGPNGKLYALPAAGGPPNLVYDSDEPNLVSLALAPDGTVYAGSAGKGLVFKITGPGRASVLYDCPGEEAKALALGPRGALFAVCNEFGEGGEAPRRPPSAAFNPAGPAGGRGKTGKGALVRVEPDGRAERWLANADAHFVSLALDPAGRPHVGTGAEGRVYAVDENRTSTLVAETDERQVGALGLAGKSRFIVSSDPAVFHEIRGTGGADATWTSKVLDAGLRASFGRLFWRSDGALEFSTRSGNSATPDATWSDWSRPINAPGVTGSPPARYVQVRARFARDPNAVLHQVVLPFVTDNARPVVTSIDAQPKGASTSSREGIVASGAEPPPRTSSIRITWKVDNPDNDQLRYRVQFRQDAQRTFRDLTRPDEVLSKAELDWDTSSLSEGTYRVRVEASDELANPPDRVNRHALESGTIFVDNTPPVFRSLTAQGRRLRADVVDGLGPVVRLDFAVDGRTEWRPLLSRDGVLDEPVEEVDADLSAALAPGPHLIALRAFDQAGNFVVRDVEMR